MKGKRKTPQVMVKGTVYNIVPAGAFEKKHPCMDCAANHNMSLCLDLPDCSNPDCIYVERWPMRRGL